ncbi:MAG: transcriptional regulator [Bacteroidetes bacterium]|nr:MAG: transcriptional regulator [Bacteroidota bacterium]
MSKKPYLKKFHTLKRSLLKDSGRSKAYEDLDAEFVLIQEIIRQRALKGLTQKELANRIGTKQSAISRFESGTYNPTVEFIKKLATALDLELRITVR